MRILASALRPVVLLLACTTALGAQAAPHTVLVRVVTDIERAPLGYSVVAAPSLQLERFTSANGAVALPVPAPGPLRLSIKRLGFTPKDTTITVSAAPSQSVTIALTRVSFKLDAVRVVAWPPCRRPGLGRRSGASAQVIAIVGQLRQNAERYRLLVKSYPFFYQARREFGRLTKAGRDSLERTDSITVTATPTWSYSPGTLVGREPVAGAPGELRAAGEWIMRIPSISDLASEAFIDNHCFHVAGLEDKEDRRLLRIDIVAAERLRGADVNVTAWLDPTDFQLRHATFMLSRTPPQFPSLMTMSSKVDYAELIPFVPVMQLVRAESLVRERRGSVITHTLIELQHTERVLFTGNTPAQLTSDSLPTPPSAP